MDNTQSNKLNAMMADLPKNVLLGSNDQGEPIYLRRPSFDCDWYWGFGYLGNAHSHYHLDGLADGKNMNLYDAIIEHFGTSLTIPKEKLWTFCEVVKTIYTLKKTAELFGLGGSHYTTNPCKEMLTKPELVAEINTVMIPALIAEMYKQLQ